LLVTREWENIGMERQIRLIQKLNLFYEKLRQYCNAIELKRILAAAAVFIGISATSRAQIFAPPVENPFGFVPPDTYLVSEALADLDNDGDQDLICCTDEGIFYYYQNTGTAEVPVFSSPQQNPFGLDNFNDPAFVSLGDIDDDGDFDLMTGTSAEYVGSFFYFENTGTPAEPAFATPVLNPFGLQQTQVFAIPAFADIDQDGDLDLFATELYGRMKFFENTGTSTNAAFVPAVPDPFGITPAYSFGAPAFADIDADGDLDLFEGEYYGNTRFFRNIGSPVNPIFDAPLMNPFGLTQLEYYSFPAIADLDNDGDLDIVILEYYGVMQYFKNLEINIGILEVPGSIDFELVPNPADGRLRIELAEAPPPAPAEVVILDSGGGIVKEQRLSSASLDLSVADLPPGLYLVKLEINGHASCRKLIIR
jgi:hypothetical protein